ncbi:hypothetical protein VTJ49DRAFT_3054 [Mycothermus thermophilus]|uniref:NADP-dependent oxidoreductase domain-containing protein n=1 Tax=Humicola insolens TaxID=85995 RepID=A0ABR3VN90_HUMIN
MAESHKPRPPLHTILPPLLLGTATFNSQYVSDPESMPYRDIVARAISLGVTGFDTSPYYGPSETLLGTALNALLKPTDGSSPPVSRKSLFLVTKAGRIAPTEFDYSPSWVRYSVLRSLRRLHTPYLDLVYMHDVEFVSADEVVAAVRELRRLRDEEKVIRYVGISGFPVDVLCSLAEKVLKETGEGLDAVLSYGHFTVQNRKLGLPWVDQPNGEDQGQENEGSLLARFKKAGVQVVLNASILGMGLLTSRGIPTDPPEKATSASPSPLAKWHPSPPELRLACKDLAALAEQAGERLESVAIRWSLAEWARVGGAAGLGVNVSMLDGGETCRVGSTVCGVTSVPELEETVAEWRGVLRSIQNSSSGGAGEDDAYGSARQEKVLDLVRNKLWPALGSWLDYAWDSPGKGYKNTRNESDRGVVPDDGVIEEYEKAKQERQGAEGSVPEAR